MKTAIELIKMYSPRPESGYGASWIIGAMEAYKAQEVAAERERIKKAIDDAFDPGQADTIKGIIEI